MSRHFPSGFHYDHGDGTISAWSPTGRPCLHCEWGGPPEEDSRGTDDVYIGTGGFNTPAEESNAGISICLGHLNFPKYPTQFYAL